MAPERLALISATVRAGACRFGPSAFILFSAGVEQSTDHDQKRNQRIITPGDAGDLTTVVIPLAS